MNVEISVLRILFASFFFFLLDNIRFVAQI